MTYLRKIASLAALLLAAAGLSVISSSAAQADIAGFLPGCNGKYRHQTDGWYETGLAQWYPTPSGAQSGYFRGYQEIGYYYCPDTDGPAKIYITWNRNGYNHVDQDLKPYFDGINNRSWVYNDNGVNWNMPWNNVKNLGGDSRYEYISAPGSLTHPENYVVMKVSSEPRWKAEMEGVIVNGVNPNYDYLTTSGGTVNHIDVNNPTDFDAWIYPGT